MGEHTHADAAKASIRVELDDQLARQVDQWRRQQDRIPSVAAAVRSLLSRGLASDGVAA